MQRTPVNGTKPAAVRVKGSVRAASNRIRVAAELVDLDSEVHLWSERFDRSLEDIFEIQVEVTLGIVRDIPPNISRAKWKRLRTHPPESLDAWSSVQAAAPPSAPGTLDALKSALALSKPCLELGPSYADAHAAATWYGTLPCREPSGAPDPDDISG